MWFRYLDWGIKYPDRYALKQQLRLSELVSEDTQAQEEEQLRAQRAAERAAREEEEAKARAAAEEARARQAAEDDKERERAAADPDHPNLLVVVMDTQRADRTSAHGYERATTPSALALAERGARVVVNATITVRAPMGTGGEHNLVETEIANVLCRQLAGAEDLHIGHLVD